MTEKTGPEMKKTEEKIPVLIVDDRCENLTALEALLGEMDLNLVRAGSGNEALRQTLYTEFAVVLLDVQMPEMDGFETAELIRRNPKTRQLPVIFVTAGMKEKSHLFKGYEAGAVDYLMKPVDPVVLRSKIRVFCELFSQRRELKRVQTELETQNQLLRETNRQLEEETSRRISMMQELRHKDKMMIQQSRMAAMGEMLGNIAHQWRQPLNTLGLTIQQLGMLYEIGEFSGTVLRRSVDQSMDVILHMSQTIDDFMAFTNPDKEKTLFRVDEAVTKTISLVRENFQRHGVAISVATSGAPQVSGYPSEFRQVLLNLLANAKDAFQEQGIDDPRLTVRSGDEAGKAVVTISDNAGGIREEIIDRIFDAYFTTKELGKGTGVGLFISKSIIEKKMGGSLTVRNVGDGAEFRIEIESPPAA